MKRVDGSGQSLIVEHTSNSPYTASSNRDGLHGLALGPLAYDAELVNQAIAGAGYAHRRNISILFAHLVSSVRRNYF